MSPKFCERELHIGYAAYATVLVDYNNYLREVYAQHLLATPLRIGGPQRTVEVNESQFERRKYHAGS